MIKLSNTSDSQLTHSLQKQGKPVGYRNQYKIKAAALRTECEPIHRQLQGQKDMGQAKLG